MLRINEITGQTGLKNGKSADLLVTLIRNPNSALVQDIE